MQERADRRGSHHGGRQPAVQWHDGVLGETKQEEGKYDKEQYGMRCQLRCWKDSALAEIEGSGHVIRQDYCGQEQYFGSTEKIDDVLASASLGLVGLLMRDERIGGQGQRFIEQEQSK